MTELDTATWLQKMLMCSEPELEMLQCAAQIWGLGPQSPNLSCTLQHLQLGQSPKQGPGAKPPEIF